MKNAEGIADVLMEILGALDSRKPEVMPIFLAPNMCLHGRMHEF